MSIGKTDKVLYKKFVLLRLTGACRVRSFWDR